MKPIHTLAAALAVAAGMAAAPALAQEQYAPIFSYRTGPYAPNGIPVANGTVDYLKLVNAKGGINGVKFKIEECEFAYDTAKGIECYERMKGQNGGAAIVQSISTGVTNALLKKAPEDKISLIIAGYGTPAAADGRVFKWVFPMIPNYFVSADVMMQAVGKKAGGLDKLKGKKINYVYMDAPFGHEFMPVFDAYAAKYGFTLNKLPVTAPGLDQKSTWLQVRRDQPDYLLYVGYGVMNPTALKEAQAVGYPREKMYGFWWAGSESDVKGVEEASKGYNAAALQASANRDAKVIKDVQATLYAKGEGTAQDPKTVGDVLYVRGLITGMLTAETVRIAQEKFGKGKPITGEQAQWALENFELTPERIEELGFTGIIQPLKTSCAQHMGSYAARMSVWDGKEWKINSDWYEGNREIIDPLIKQFAEKYAADNKIEQRQCAN
ncbi:ABC transporter substrate-binding protein [Comamonas sp. NLF-1-9]|uniref:ABC transporter substrate-binding protein n=1 Tax=Comamonas sp. NLF-1-9 TaxID=2853163 RepID=UPI001C4731D0|nr:ABC transporter substrate-binding protein [Comamonas sp. NLF-1-9]QXL84205.1 ABC transporter substrate-binding protein [Comamonas sp. NLF-1-9]